MMAPSHENKWSAQNALRFGFACVALLIFGLGGWSLIARIDGAVVASGQVQVELNRQVVAHRGGGEVKNVHVREGDLVSAGAPLVTLLSQKVQTEIAVIETQYFEQLARQARLTAERDGLETITFSDELLERSTKDGSIDQLIKGQQNLFDARKQTAQSETEQLKKRVSQIDAQIEGIDAQLEALQTSTGLIGDQLANQESLLSRGLTQQAQVTTLQRELLETEANIGQLKSRKAQAEVQATEVELAILKIVTDRRESAITELRETSALAARLREQRLGLRDDLEKLVLRSPTDGIVHGLSVFGPGAVISAAAPVLYIVPQDRPLVISVRVSPIHIDQVYPGQPVRLRFTTFDQRNTPELNGEVLRASADAFQDDATGENFYRAEIQLSESERARLPEGTNLIPGMPVEAYMSTGERTALAYLTRPLTDYFIRAFRED